MPFRRWCQCNSIITYTGVEAAHKYFIDARKSPNFTYHVYVAYATMIFCMDKDTKYARNVFEVGLKRFIQEPGYILEYEDFLSRLNDDRNSLLAC
nr:cleavage stimulation factor subunit 77 [Tanacetum cinerariifolium]